MNFRWVIRCFGVLKVTVTGNDIARILRERGATVEEVATVLIILDAVQARFAGGK